MEYTELGTSGLRVSRLCVGCMSFGDPASGMHAWTLNAADSAAIIRRALDLGVNFFDTANVYSGGTSEEYLGRAIKDAVPRDKVVVATKVFFNEGKLSREAILREIDGSLRRLGTDYVDLYIIHRFDSGTPAEETMEALHSLVKAGKVRALGASAMYGYQFFNLQLAAARNGWTPFVSMQNHYNLLYREDERELIGLVRQPGWLPNKSRKTLRVLLSSAEVVRKLKFPNNSIPVCRQWNAALTPSSPLAAGRLARLGWQADTKRSQTDTTAMSKYDGTREADYGIALRVHSLAEKYGVTMTQIALAWHFAKGVASTLIGATRAEYFDDAAGAFNVRLTEEDVAFLEELYTPHKIVGAL